MGCGLRTSNLLKVAVVVLSSTVFSVTDAFLSGAPSGPPPRTKPPQPEVDINKDKAVGDKAAASPLVDGIAKGPSPTIETITVGTPQQHTDNLLLDSELTTAQARAIALEAATSKTVPKATALEALHCLTRSTQAEPLKDSAPAPVESIDGVWRLCFCDGDFLPGMEVDDHGYVSRDQDVHIMFDAQGERIILGSRGLESTPNNPKVVIGGLAYTPETQTVVGRFQEESSGIALPALQACLVDAEALGFHTMTEAKQHGFLLFKADKSKATEARLSHAASLATSSAAVDSGDLSEEPTAAEVAALARATTAKVASEQLLDLKLNVELISQEEIHENKRLAVQEGGKTAGSLNTFMRYLETEGGSIYAVVAGPILYSYLTSYSPVASTKATAAAIVMVETAKHILKASI